MIVILFDHNSCDLLGFGYIQVTGRSGLLDNLGGRCDVGSDNVI